MPGPPPKPTALRVLQGNPSKRPLPAGEPRPPLPSSTYAPRHLNGEAKKEWRRLVVTLVDLGLYTEVDRAALAMYCQAWGRWVEAERRLSIEGPVLISDKGNYYQNPYLHVANRAWEEMRKMLGEFGLTPASRCRLSVAQPEEPDELAQLLFNRGVAVNG
jgi:P27 family predicted phage terminase small subunit